MAEPRPRLLLVTRNFPPLWGGMERLNWHMAQELARQYEVHVVGPAGACEHSPEGVHVSDVPLRPMVRFLVCATWTAVRVARRERPRVILAGSGLTAPIAWLAGSLSGAFTAAYVHGLDLVVPSWVYRWIWVPLLRRIDRVIANSRATAALATRVGVGGDHIRIVHPGVEVPSLETDARARFRARHGLGERPVLLSVGRLTVRKGLREFVAQVLPKIVAQRPDLMLLIVGDVPVNALFAEAQTPESILRAAQAAGVDSHVRFLRPQFGLDLAEAYAGADVHVFPVREIPNDPEGFGMVALEAASHGVPTVAYATGGVVDAVSEGVSGSLVPPHDADAFADAVIRILKSPPSPQAMQSFATSLAWPAFGMGVRQALETMSR